MTPTRDSFDATASYTAANGVSYSAVQHAAVTWDWDSTRLFSDDGTSTDSGTALYANQTASSWRNDVMASNQTSNFTSNTQYDGSGYPTDLYATPVANTTLLARWFDAGASAGQMLTTWSVANGA